MTCLITRRSMLIGAAASLICAPSIVRASSLMPIRRVIIEANAFGPKKPICLGFAGSLALFWMKKALERGWDDKVDGPTFGGISETQARNHVAYVKYHGTLPPPGARVVLTQAEVSRIAAVRERGLSAT